MFPAFWIITTVINAFLTALLVIGIFRRIDDVFEDLLIWLSVALLFTTFFQSLLAALMASLISRTHEIPARLVGEAPSEKERKSGTRSRRGKRLVTA
jgi:hypothetical protein